MLKIFICEDERLQRQQIEQVVNNYILMEDLDANLVVSTGNPQDVLDYLALHPETKGLYFLDIDLNHDLTGIMLGKKIREQDGLGKIVFVTGRGDLAYLSFTYWIEAMDYIVKNGSMEDLSSRIAQCVKVANERFLYEKSRSNNTFKVKIGNTENLIPVDDILFFATTVQPHRIELHTENRILTFTGSMKEVEKSHHDFLRVHTSFIVNRNYIKEIDRKNRILILKSGQQCDISVRGLKILDAIDIEKESE